MADIDLRYGDVVAVPWGVDSVRATVREIYGSAPDYRVVVVLTPELSDGVVCEPTTLALPLNKVTKVAPAA